MGGVKSPGNRGVLGKDRGQFGPRAVTGRGQPAVVVGVCAGSLVMASISPGEEKVTS